MAEYRHIANLKGDKGDTGDPGNPVRGQIPAEITALSQMNHADYNGIWQANTQHALTDAPFEITQATLVEILIGSPANAAKQVVTDIRESWWREANVGGSGTVSSWGQWRKYADLDDVAGAGADALRSRPNLPDGTNIDNVRGVAAAGAHRMPVTFTYDGTWPAGDRSDQQETLFVLPSGNDGQTCTQMILRYNETWIRHAPGAVWGAWRRIFPAPAQVTAHAIVATHAASNWTSSARYFDKLADVPVRPASTLKILTLHVARQVITGYHESGGALLDDTVTVTAADITANPGGSGGITFQAGDVISYRDLMYAMMLPSSNWASEILARAVGEQLTGDGTPRERFIQAMHDAAESFGWTGYHFTNPTGLGNGNRLSASMLIQLMYEVGANQTNRWLMGDAERTITITGPNARTQVIRNTTQADGDVPFPEMVAAKTGSLENGEYACLAMLWTKPDGTHAASAILGSNAENRFKDMRALIDTTIQTQNGISTVTRPITLTAADDLLTLVPGRTYIVPNISVATALGMPRGNRAGRLTVSEASNVARLYMFETTSGGTLETPHEVWVRGWTNGEFMTPWEQTHPESGTSVSSSLKEIAREDDWTSLFDPTDRSTVSLNNSRGIVRIVDALGNMPDLAPRSTAPTRVLAEFGQLAGISTATGRALTTGIHDPIAQPVTITTILRNSAVGGTTSRFAIDGTTAAGRCAILQTAEIEGHPLAIFSGQGELAGGSGADNDPHVVTAHFDGPRSWIRVDGQTVVEGGHANAVYPLQGLSVGSDRSGGRAWEGSVGPVLIRQGAPDMGAIDRAERFLHSVSSTPRQQVTYRPNAIILSSPEPGLVSVSHGAVDTVHEDWGIASITKLMTMITARQTLTSEESLDQVVTVEASDLHSQSGARLQEGDQITIRELMYAAALPSDNTAPMVIARAVGEMLSGTGTAVEKFLQAMRDQAAAWGWDGAVYTQPWNQARMSARQVVDLQRRILGDATLKAITGAREHDLQMVRNGEPRTVSISHTILSSTVDLPEWTSGKTGTWQQKGNLAIAWTDGIGREHVTAILNVSRDNTQRYQELAKVVEQTSL